MENFYRKFAIPSSQTLAMFRIPEKSTKELIFVERKTTTTSYFSS